MNSVLASLYHHLCHKHCLYLKYTNGLIGVPHNPPSRTLGPNKQPSADNLFHHALANMGECMRVCVCERERQKGEVETVQGHEYSIKLSPGNSHHLPWPLPCVHQVSTETCPWCSPEYTQYGALITSHHTRSSVWIWPSAASLQPPCGSPSLLARGPSWLPALAWVVGWGGVGIWGHWSCPLVLLQPCLLIHPSLPAHRSIALLS